MQFCIQHQTTRNVQLWVIIELIVRKLPTLPCKIYKNVPIKFFNLCAIIG